MELTENHIIFLQKYKVKVPGVACGQCGLQVSNIGFMTVHGLIEGHAHHRKIPSWGL